MPNATPKMSAAEYRRRHGSSGKERNEQKALVKCAAAKEGEIPALKLLHVPNGGNRTARAGARMKAMRAK